MTAALTSHTLPACPSWCTSPAGHPFTDEAADGSYVARYHEAPNLAGVVAGHEPMARTPDRAISTSISSEERVVSVPHMGQGGAVSDDGPSVQAPPVIILWTENPVLTAGDARAVAALLLREADRLDELTGRAS